MKTKNNKLFAFAIIFSLITSFGFSQDKDPKTFTPDQGKALVYILRPSAYAMAIKFKVSSDGIEIGATRGKRFVYTMLTPGKHTIVSKANNTAQLELTVEAGKTYFIKQTPTMGITAGNDLSVLDETTGREDLKSCKCAN